MESNIKLGILKTILVIMILLVLAYVWKMDYESLEKRYVIGTTRNVIPAWGQGADVQFEYFIFGEKEIKASPRGVYRPKKGEKYLIEVPIQSREKAKILLNYPVPDSIKSPWEGWEEIPEFLRKK